MRRGIIDCVGPCWIFFACRRFVDGEYVIVHGLYKNNAEERGTVAVDIFRIKDGKIDEHWDVLQPVPEKSANPHPMF